MRLGLMGGTFDPIHYGHLAAAEAVRHELELAKVVFVPAGRPPHKAGHQVSPAVHRMAMVRQAVASNPFFEVSDIEVDRPGPSFTVDTVKEYGRLYPGAEIYFLTGTDAVAEIASWHRFEELLGLCRLTSAIRPGCTREVQERLARLPESIRCRVHLVEVPAVAVSSTEIRERVYFGKPVKYLLPETVEDYIIRHGLYRTVKA
ncbi:MAG: nicotinate-nucleotide adenylyltransferase [Bacillota bacterium]